METLPGALEEDELTPRNSPENDTEPRFVFPTHLAGYTSTEPGSNTTSEAELEYDDEFSAPALADDLIREINNMPPHLTPQMENALEIRKSRNVLQHAVTSWQDEF